MSFFTREEVASVLGGRWLSQPKTDVADPSGAVIDSRSIPSGAVFFALKGDRTDGHRFAGQALRDGASMVIADDEQGVDTEAGVLLVPDSKLALAKLAGAWRDRLRESGCSVIGVTGTNGKTTTVRLIHAVLSAKWEGTRPPKSFNNDIGLPLTLLNTPESSRFVVCELGINAPGEMKRLVEIARPEIALITSIGRGHLAALGSIAGVAREKAGILRGPELSGVDRSLALVTADSPDLSALLPGAASGASELRRIGNGPGGERVDIRAEEPEGTEFDFDGEWFRVPLVGAHNAVNAAFAVSIGRWFGFDAEAIRSGLKSVQAPSMRLARTALSVEAGKPEVTVINDAYNANPESTRAAIGLLRRDTPGPGGRRIAVLGDMLELGPDSPDLHRELGAEITKAGGIDLVVPVGRQMAFVAERIARDWSAERVVPYIDLDDRAAREIAAMVHPGDVVLLKASRSMGLERVAEALEARTAVPRAGGG